VELQKKDIRKLSLTELEEFFLAHGEKKFRAKQVYEWLWNKSLKNFDEMSNISLSTRELLKTHFSINHIRVDLMQHSSDGTIKNAVKLFDDKIVESVLIPTTKRITACISSQVGCSLDCNFCATARLKRMRNLNSDEIYDQVVAIKDEAETYFQRPLTNIVFMGMGEPLLNYANVIDAIDKITSPDGLGMAPRRITLSTVGIPKMIRAKFCKIIPSKVNLIQYNPIDEGEFRQASQEAVDLYVKILEGQGIIAKVRKSRGQDIDAACGQLANKNEVAQLQPSDTNA